LTSGASCFIDLAQDQTDLMIVLSHPLAIALMHQTASLAIAALGGVVFDWANIPAPWLSAGMLVTGVLAASGKARPMLPAIRDFAMLLGGISLGTGVTPETLQSLAAVPASLALLALAIVLIMGLSSSVLIRLFGWTRLDAMLASAPGALSTVLVVAMDEKADIPRIATVQLFRLVMLVAVMPSLIVSAGVAGTPPVITQPVIDPIGLAIIFALALPSAFMLERIRMPAPLLLGGMLATGALTGSGSIDGHFPTALATLGFLMIGCFIGERFRTLRRREVIDMAPAALVSFLITTGVAGALSAVASLYLDAPAAETMIAFAPGGLEAMSVLAFSLHLDPVYVAAHHLARFLAVGLWMPVAIRIWPRLFGIARAAERFSS
jgi:membrane AbrB-like protein